MSQGEVHTLQQSLICALYILDLHPATFQVWCVNLDEEIQR